MDELKLQDRQCQTQEENDKGFSSTCKGDIRSSKHDEDKTAAPELIFTAYDHRFIQITFSSLQCCDSCHKFLRGIYHQGFLCQSMFSL